MASVSLEGVSKRFSSGSFAVRALDLEIADGEFLCLVGPSGCGKSTTLNLIAGLAQPSGGQVRLGGRDVALGRALVRRPAAFLFDEPLSNLDANLRAQMRGELKKLHETLGGTFVYVTHDQAEAMTLSDRVALMNEGRLEQLGSARELYEKPRSLFAARFFGAPMINVCAPAALGVAGNDRSVVALRPEHLSFDPRGALQGRVYLVEPMGADAWITVELPGARVIARCEGSVRARVGEEVRLGFAREQLKWFDASTGLAQ